MTTQPDAPADTTMMRIVHEALRRDLRRAQAALTADPPPGLDRRRAIATHLTWMMQFLRAHHRSEEEGLYALVRQRADRRADVLDTLELMDMQHDAIVPAILAVESAARTLAVDGDDDGEMAAALDKLAAVLLPHLEQEEAVAMPIVSALITNAEWQAIEQEHNLQPKSFVELGREGHWLIDDVDEEDRATVVGLVPAIPRFFLLHAFARRYRRQREACWGTLDRAPRRVQKHGRVAVTVDADIESVWEIARDVTRVGEWSHECVEVSWIGEATSPTAGARFRGRNRSGVFRWGRVCEIVACDPYEIVWRTVPSALYPDSSEWRITLDKVGDGTRIEQRFDVIRAPKLLDLLYGLMIPAHRDRTAALTEDLHRLGALAGRSPAEDRPPEHSTTS